MLNGIQNFLQFINDNWTAIVIIASLIIAIIQKVRTFLSKSKNEKIDIAKLQIKEIVLKLISDAEQDYESWTKAGSIKRAQVIQKIFTDYPILSKFSNQESIVEWIDNIIDESLKTLREIVSENQS